MIYSGSDLIRMSGRQVERIERLTEQEAAQAIASASNVKDASNQLDGDSRGALLRFARFIHDEKGKKERPPEEEITSKPKPLRGGGPVRLRTKQHPYVALMQRYREIETLGYKLNIFI